LLIIDNKIPPLPVWRYVSKPFGSLCICVTPTISIQFSKKKSRQQCIINWQSKCHISVKSANASNSYSVFCEVSPKVNCLQPHGHVA